MDLLVARHDCVDRSIDAAHKLNERPFACANHDDKGTHKALIRAERTMPVVSASAAS